MTINNLFTTTEYHQYIISLNQNESLKHPKISSVIPAKSIGRKWAEEKKASPAKKNPYISSTYFSANDRNNFIRITNVTNWLPESDAALVITADNYRNLQQLGITAAIDQSLTAKIINYFGDYRFKVFKDQEQYGLRTSLFKEKEDICQHAFNRLYALQKIERTFGQDPTVIIESINHYEIQIKTLIKQKLMAVNYSWAAQVVNLDDNWLGYFKKLHRNTVDFVERTKINEIIDLYEDLSRADSLYYEILELKLAQGGVGAYSHYGFDSTKFPIEKFIRMSSSHIINNSKLTNELITIANGESIFRGILGERLANAEIFCKNFTFHQNHLITPEHQGDYKKQEQVTVSSQYAVGNKREDVRRFLFAASVVLSGTSLQVPTTVSKTRGWTRFFRREKKVSIGDSSILANYKMLRSITLRANLSWVRSSAGDVIDLKNVFFNSVYKLGRGVLNAFGHEFYKVGADYFIQKPLTAPSLTTMSKLKLTSNEHKILLQEKWHHADADELLNHVIKYIVKDSHPPMKLKTSTERFLKLQRQKTHFPTAPLALPPNQLNHTDPDDFLSSIIHGFESFYQMFDQIYEANPSTAFYGTCMYALAGLSVVNPELTKLLFNKIHLSIFYEPFTAWNTATARMMTKGKFSNFVSAGFTLAQEFFVLSQILSQAGDSVGGDICRLLSNHFPKAIGGVAAASGLGYLVTRDFFAEIPIVGRIGALIKEDVGTVPAFEEFFAGVKLGTLAHEALQSKPESQSILANFFSFCFKCILYPIRLFISSPINLLLTMKTPGRLYNAGKPWLELGLDLRSMLLRGVDAILRILNLIGQVLKLIIKTPTEVLLNLLVITTKLIGKFFVNPKQNILSTRLIHFKNNLFSLLGTGTSRIKNFYRSSRNTVARNLRTNLTMRSTTAWVTQSFERDSSKLDDLDLSLERKNFSFMRALATSGERIKDKYSSINLFKQIHVKPNINLGYDARPKL